ncbi:SRPBCC family protein [Ramlibacter sp. PS4R-6]|uniref:SRPBCC family protein n=1 Tax=Ramlibacter sp. PS4R-6 TaxID=3133438 RepID=UPI0030A2ACA9
MKILNVHQRLLNAAPERVSAVLATLGQPGDLAWPGRHWSRMKLDRPLSVGAVGGHGPIRYFVEACEPQFVAFRLTMPGVDGWHGFEILDATASYCVLEHRIEADVKGAFLLKWIFAIRALHDACVEDVFAQIQVALGETPRYVPWSPYVRFLMWLFSRGGKSRATRRPHAA